jgi:hypothetical protein
MLVEALPAGPMIYQCLHRPFSADSRLARIIDRSSDRPYWEIYGQSLQACRRSAWASTCGACQRRAASPGRGRAIRLPEDLPEGSGDNCVLPLRYISERVPHKGTRRPCQAAPVTVAAMEVVRRIWRRRRPSFGHHPRSPWKTSYFRA